MKIEQAIHRRIMRTRPSDRERYEHTNMALAGHRSMAEELEFIETRCAPVKRSLLTRLRMAFAALRG